MANRGMAMICANPDIVIHRGDTLIYCAGALARVNMRSLAVRSSTLASLTGRSTTGRWRSLSKLVARRSRSLACWQSATA